MEIRLYSYLTLINVYINWRLNENMKLKSELFSWGTTRLKVHELKVMFSTNRPGECETLVEGDKLSWPFCLRRMFAQVSQTQPSLYWKIWIFCSSLFQLKAGSRRKDSRSCCFCLRREDFCNLHRTCRVIGYFRFIKNKLTGSILILSTFGFLACLTVIDSMVLKEKQHDTQYVNNTSCPQGFPLHH